jgi:alkylhydroperoxidase/carboxymuconolactone decarboxylase family protein YurZ
MNTATTGSRGLDSRQEAIAPIAAFAAAGNRAGLNGALELGLDAGLSISEAREILIQLYAYAGFPRSLNALGELMKVVQARQLRGIEDQPGCAPSHCIPQGDALLAAGTANQTRLAGGTVSGPLFDFAPVINEYLRSHLFGAIFERDNLDWQSRELATLGMLAALPGAEAQLQAHFRISLNIGITIAQLQIVARVLGERVDRQTGERAQSVLAQFLATHE